MEKYVLELQAVLDKYRSLGISQQIDYDKFYLYSIITHSTAIEGSTVTEIENQLLFDEGISAKGKPLVEQLMNLDLKHAYEQSIRWAKEHKPFSVEMLKQLSALVMKNTGSVYSTLQGEFDSSKGDLRLLGVTAGAGGRSYMNFLKAPARLADFCNEINRRRELLLEKPSEMDAYLLSFDAHNILVSIHPWVDGNGRMSRLIMNHLQFEFNLVPTKVMTDDKAAFRKRYSLAELDVAYYIERLERLPLLSPERKLLQELFLDKWHRLLTTKEYDYQYHHIGSLCEGFVLLDKQNGLKTVADVTGSRVRWLLLNRPELYRRIVPYEKAMEQNRHIRELVRVLGKHSKGEKRSFDPLGGVREEQLVRHAVRSDIEGITLGNDLNHLLPVEYCYLTDEVLRPVFMQKFVEKRLQVFDSRSAEDSSVLQKGRKPVSGQGPFVVCLDTSGSMQGKREILAKSALLAVAKLVDGTHRKCYVINFAEDIHCMLIKDLRADFPLLADFLNYRFDGGTNMVPALKEAVRLIQTNGWHRSDVVMISDFEMPPVGDELMKQIMGIKHRDTSFYALVFGSRPEMDYLSICDRTWEMEIP